MNTKLLTLISIVLLYACNAQENKENIDYVNPMIGAFAPAGSDLEGRERDLTTQSC